MTPRISVIVPVYNREKLIVRTLDSIFSQTMLPDELIVVDNGSTDATYFTVKLWMDSHANSAVKFKLLTENKPGACAARQKGLENATGEYLSFFDSDDVMLPHLIKKASDTISLHPDADIVCWKAKIFSLDGSNKVPPFIPSNPLESHLIHTLLRPQGYIVRKNFIIKAGGWKKDLPVWNDLELGLRLLLLDPVIYPINDILAEIHAGEDSITGKDFSHKHSLWEATLKEMNQDIIASSHTQKERLKKIIDYRRAILAAHYYRENNKTGASKLMSDTMKGIPFLQRIPLHVSYLYTRHGFRGAWRFIRYFI